MPKAYEGNEPYIFISYAHNDKEEVFRYVDALQKNGFRVWFDGGIEAGSEWPENIAKHLRKCACVIAFVSENFVNSEFCRREIAFSQDLKIEQLSVFIQNLQPNDLPDGVRLQLGLNQFLFRENFETDEAFVEEIVHSSIVGPCRGEASEVAVDLDSKKKIKNTLFNRFLDRTYERVGSNEKEKKEHWQRVSKALVWICILIELAYIPISPKIIGYMAYNGNHIFYIALFLIVVHFILAWYNLTFYVFVRGMVRRARIDQKPLRDAKYYMGLATLASLCVSIFTGAEGLASGYTSFQFLFGSPYATAIYLSAIVNSFSSSVALILYSFLREKKHR